MKLEKNYGNLFPYSLYPADAGDRVVLQLTELRDSAGLGVPHVDRVSQTHTQDITATPINEVQIKIVLQIRGVQDLVGNLVYITRLLPRCLQNALAVVPDRRETV